SMKSAIDETDRRRMKQEEHNKLYNITPESIKKAILDSLGNTLKAETDTYMNESHFMVGLSDTEQELLHDPRALAKEIKKLEEKMLKAAADLEFEEATKLRDAMRRLGKVDLMLR
ncbi:MAG: UvrB/UvrC motif-containing protein, partial [Pseudomonadota bacterium]